MAKDNCTGKVRPVKIPTERRITVGHLYYERPPLEHGEPRRSRPVPWLQMRGDWLAAAGFDIKTPVRVRVMEGCLVLTLAGE
jgi:toxic protein SymE